MASNSAVMQWFITLVVGVGIGALIAPLTLGWLLLGIRYLNYPVKPNWKGTCIHAIVLFGSIAYLCTITNAVSLALHFPNWADHFAVIGILAVWTWAAPSLIVAVPMVKRLRHEQDAVSQQQLGRHRSDTQQHR
jgi:hypothetical protein